MPRPRKTEAQRRADRFSELYRMGKARIGFTEAQVGQAIGITTPSLRERRKHPEKFTLGEIAIIGGLFGWSGEDFASIYQAGKQ